MQHSSSSSNRRLILLGSTGSIGVNAVAVIEHLRETGLFDFEVVGLAAGANGSLLIEQAKRLNARHVAIADPIHAGKLNEFDRWFAGPQAALELIESVAREGDLVVGAMVGFAGVPAILAAIDRGCDIALANKETLVAAGAIVMPRIRARDVKLIPIDSEHSAIFQCLETSSSTGHESLKRIVLTASGGPFRSWPAKRMQEASVEEALNHPTWTMGPKVTIDSASLMNKALEIIEAHWLFDLPAEKIDVIIHPQSIIHGMVEYVDGSVVAQLGPPDMRTPIQYALTWPHRLPGISRAMDWTALRKLEFEPVDHEKFIAPGLAYEAVQRGGTAGALLNAANEAAVSAFLDRRIAFGQIAEIVRDVLHAIEPVPVRTMNEIVAADRQARDAVSVRLKNASSGRLAMPSVQ
jgi:1-deoxy-D-xylulose-5-phosphate reductoisomerase